MKKYGLFEAK
jgi:DNA-binding NtrC family response regulator